MRTLPLSFEPRVQSKKWNESSLINRDSDMFTGAFSSTYTGIVYSIALTLQRTKNNRFNSVTNLSGAK